MDNLEELKIAERVLDARLRNTRERIKKLLDEPTPREYTVDEVREKFLKHCRGLVKYWENVDVKTTSERLSGLMFSALVALDGGSIDLPAFSVSPAPHPDDKEYHREKNENWFPESGCDISGYLHELFYQDEK